MSSGVMFGGIDCYKCGHIKSIEGARQMETWVESSKSGDSITFRGWGSSGGWTDQSRKFKKKGGGISYNPGRTYYRKKIVYICKDCLRKEAQKRKNAATFWRWVWFGIAAIVVYNLLT